MAKFNTDTLSLFHTFSKTQVNSDANKPQFSSLGNTVNKSGHTVQSNEIWTEAIPFFGLGVPADFSSTAQVNDLVKDADGVIWQRNATPYTDANGTYWTQKTKSITSFTKGTDGKYTFTEVDGALVDGSYLLNAAGVPTVKYHAKKQLTPLISDNNAFIDSENDASRLKIDGKWVDQFIGVTDVYVNGSAAVSYAPVLFSNSSSTTPLKAGAGEDYLDYCATGIILWDKNECTGNEVISCFEYVGAKLDTTLTTISDSVKDIVNTTMQSVVASVGTNDAAQNAGIGVDSTITTSPKITFTSGSVTTGETRLVSGGTVAAVTDALSELVSGVSQTVASIQTELSTDISDAKAAAKAAQDTADAKVASVTGGNSLVTVSGDKNVTITVSDTIATKTDAANAASSAITTSLNDTTTPGTIGKAITDVAATANSAVQSVTRAAGSSTLLTVTDGTDATISLSTEVATKADITTEINKLSAADGAITTLSGKVSDIETSLAAGGTTAEAIVAAKKAGTDAQTAADAKVADVTVDGASIVSGAAGSKTAALTTTKAVAITPSADSASTALATEASVAKALASITSVGVSYEVIPDGQTHTSITAPVNGRIYLEKDETNAEAGVYIEWMYTEKGWEQIGSTKTDHSSYASTITVNGSPKTVADSAVDLGAFASTVTAGNGVESGRVTTTGALELTLTTASTTTAGISQLTDTYKSTDDKEAATGKAIADAIATIETTDIGSGAVKVSQADGKVTSVTVETEALVSEDAIKEIIASDTALVTAKSALEAIKLAKPENFVASVTGYTEKGAEVTTDQGATVKVLDGRGTSVTVNDLWGTTATMDASGVITISHNKLSNPNASECTAWIEEITKVEDNKAYNGDAAVANIQTGMIKDGSHMFYKTNLASFNGDLSSLTAGYYMFYNTELTSFSSDLSSLTNGSNMFAYCSQLESFSSDLSGLTSGDWMFSNCSNLTSFSSDLSSLTNAYQMFNGCSNLTSFSSDLSGLIKGNWMFYSSGLKSFTSDLSSLTDGKEMFYRSHLKSFSSDLSSLTDGNSMFAYCSQLTSFSSDLSSLTNGSNMFHNCSGLKSFTSDLSSLTNGSNMFTYCSHLTSFNGDLTSLTNGYSMFNYCSKLASFCGDLSSLTNGGGMFNTCELDTESVEIIADTINDVTELEYSSAVTKRIDIGIGNDEPSPSENAAFKQMQDKGWSVYVNGSSTEYVPSTEGEASLDETGETRVAPKPYWAKPIEVTEDNAEYVGQDGKFYQVVGGQFIYVNDPDTYGMFVSREDAIANMRLTKYEKPVEEEN